MAQPYHYDRIDVNQVRLFHLVQAGENDNLSGYIKIYDLVDGSPLPDNIVVTGPTPDDQDEDVGPPSASQGPAPAYNALSYFWGDYEASTEIQILTLTQYGPKPYLRIKPNLADALKQLRKMTEGEELILWIDAICIDQKNFAERNVQIQCMADIYSRASMVYIWLGSEYENSAAAIKFAKNMPDIRKFNRDVKATDKNVEPEIIAFYNIMHREWFNRRWIVQEICLAKNALVLCGGDEIPWNQLEEAISLFSAHRKDIRQRIRQSQTQGNPHDFTGEVDAMGAVHLVEITNNITHRADDGSVTEHRVSLEGLMSSLTMFQTSNPYDIVYALLWLASDYRVGGAFAEPYTILSNANSPTPSVDHHTQLLANTSHSHLAATMPRGRSHSRSISSISVGDAIDLDQPRNWGDINGQDLVVNYSQTVFEVYATFLRHVFRRSKSVDILCHPWAMDPPTERPEGAPRSWTPEPPLPSWILVLRQNKIFEINADRQVYERLKADPLVGRPGNGSRVYWAYAKQRAEGEQAPVIDIQARSLSVYGFVLGELDDIEDSAYGGVIPEAWLQSMGWTDESNKRRRGDYQDWRSVRSEDTRPSWIWRLLVADRGTDGHSHPPTRWRSVCAWLLDHRTEGAGINTFPTDQQSDDAAEFLQRARAVVWRRRLAKIYSPVSVKDMFALVPQGTRQNDLVCILAGCSVPVVLRRRRTSRRASAGTPSNSNNHINVSRTASDLNAFPPIPPSEGRESPNNTPRPSTCDDERFEFIGEAYVHGMMYGEGYKHRRENGVDFRRFVIL